MSDRRAIGQTHAAAGLAACVSATQPFRPSGAPKQWMPHVRQARRLSETPCLATDKDISRENLDLWRALTGRLQCACNAYGRRKPRPRPALPAIGTARAPPPASANATSRPRARTSFISFPLGSSLATSCGSTTCLRPPTARVSSFNGSILRERKMGGMRGALPARGGGGTGGPTRYICACKSRPGSGESTRRQHGAPRGREMPQSCAAGESQSTPPAAACARCGG